MAGYDALRLITYRDHEALQEKIVVRRIGNATVLRFDDVGYFNRIYVPGSSVTDRLPEIERIFRGCPFPAELIGPVDQHAEGLEEECRRRGWIEGPRYSWLGADVPALPDASPAAQFSIACPRVDQQQLFLDTYLTAFEADPKRFAPAVRNMRHLFRVPELRFLMARRNNQPAGIAMLAIFGDDALLCAGAVLPSFRDSGCHAALLSARIQMVRELGCRRLFSWAATDGRSEYNMRRAGLQLEGIARAWRFQGRSFTDV